MNATDSRRRKRRMFLLLSAILIPAAVLITLGVRLVRQETELTERRAAEERRDIQILERRGQAADHPVAATCPESNYLKCLISRVR